MTSTRCQLMTQSGLGRGLPAPRLNRYDRLINYWNEHETGANFIAALGGAAALPLAAHAQQPERTRRIGVLMAWAADDSGITGPHRCVPAGLGAIGLDRRPQRADRHSLGHPQCRRPSQTGGRIGRARARHHPVWDCTATLAPLLQATRTVPIVFTIVIDPVGSVSSRAWRGRAATPPVSDGDLSIERPNSHSLPAHIAAAHRPATMRSRSS